MSLLRNQSRKPISSKASKRQNTSQEVDQIMRPAKELQKDFEDLRQAIEENDKTHFLSLLHSPDMRYFLINNDLDFTLFKAAIKVGEPDFIHLLENADYTFNKDTFLIELYDNHLLRNFKEKAGDLNESEMLKEDDFKLIINYKEGYLLDPEVCSVEFYFLMLTGEFELANQLLSKNYCTHIKEDINQMFIGDENNLIQHILMSPELVKSTVKVALMRQLDGIAYEIMDFSGVFLDEKILKCAVKNDCNLFLEEIWESTRKFGNLKNFYAPKISFSVFLECMLKKKKFEMASDAIKNWYEVYKEENLFELLLRNRSEELLIDLIETASHYNYTVDFAKEDFEQIVKEFYFLLQVILGKPMYKKFINSEEIQKDLVDPLRKGQTILPAIECYNAIDDHLLVITHIENAGKVLLDFIKAPKKFIFCRSPLLLCCLVAEFMEKLKLRFPVYESFFMQIYKSFVEAGRLFASKIKDLSNLEYHLNRRDLKHRTCLQIMSQNRIYTILKVDNVGGIIGKYWTSANVQYSLVDMSSFTQMLLKYEEKEVYSFKLFAHKNNATRQFSFSYSSFKYNVSTRYYFKEMHNIVLVLLLTTLIYLSVIDKNLENTINGHYPFLSNMIFYGSLILVLNKISSIFFFSLVNRWYMEIDNLLGEICFITVILLHKLDAKRWFIDENDTDSLEFANAILLSMQILYLWWRVLDSLKATKSYGGFLRTVLVMVRKLFLIVGFFYCVILLFTGMFNLLFNQFTQFNNYFVSFFFLAQAALQEYDIDEDWTIELRMFLICMVGICTLILINLIIALATKIYDDVEKDIEPEHRGNLIKIYEYLRWDENYGIFKFLHAPFNLVQFPFALVVLFSDNKVYWTDKFCKVLYFFVALIYFLIFIVINLFQMVHCFCINMFIFPFRYRNPLVRLGKWALLGWAICIYYFVVDIIEFWHLAYSDTAHEASTEDKSKTEILEFKRLFSNLISDISERVEEEKKAKRFSLVDLVMGWLFNLSDKKLGAIVPQDENNRMHKRSLIMHKYRTSVSNNNDSRSHNTTLRNSHAQLFKHSMAKVSILEHFNKILKFLEKFADKEGYIDKELARNIFQKKSYYDDEYFEYLYYFDYKYFKQLIAKFSKNKNEVQREMDMLKGIFSDVLAVREKFALLKKYLRNMDRGNIKLVNKGIFTLNKIFAILENNILNAQNREFQDEILAMAQNKSSYIKNKSTKKN